MEPPVEGCLEHLIGQAMESGQLWDTPVSLCVHVFVYVVLSAASRHIIVRRLPT